MSVIWLLLGGALLYVGGELLVGHSIRLARSLGLSPMVIGLTVVSLGTSAPELAASLAAVYGGSPDIALGNVVGSNIANIGLIMGSAALIRPLGTTGRFIRREVPYLFGMSALLCAFVYEGTVGQVEGLLLLGFLGVFLVYLLRFGESESAEIETEFADEYEEHGVPAPAWKGVLGAAAGIGLLVLGAEAFVEGAVGLARNFGISERIIGLTVVAFGTSLPELASSIVAAVRRQADIVVGNVIGSNIFNIVTVLGTTALLKPFSVEHEGLVMDLGVMMGMVVLAWVFLTTRLEVNRQEGGLLLVAYLVYVGVLFV